MELLVANTQDASLEKHVPVVNICSNSVEVKVGSVPHPMVKEHYIQWICLETENRTQIAYLSPEDKPEANFCICGEKIKAVYEYCNLHGLWKAELPEEIADVRFVGFHPPDRGLQEINCHPDFSHGCVE